MKSKVKNCKFKLELSPDDQTKFYQNINNKLQIELSFISQILTLGKYPHNGKSLQDIEKDRALLNISEDSEKDVAKMFEYIKSTKKNKYLQVYSFFTGKSSLESNAKNKDELQCFVNLTKSKLLPFKFPDLLFNNKSCIVQALEKIESFLASDDLNSSKNSELKKNDNSELSNLEIKSLNLLFEIIQKDPQFSLQNLNKNWKMIRSKILKENFNIDTFSKETICCITSYKDILYSSNFDLIPDEINRRLNLEKLNKRKDILSLNIKNINHFRIGSNYENFKLLKENNDIYMIYNSSCGPIKMKVIPHKENKIWELKTIPVVVKGKTVDTLHLITQRPSEFVPVAYKAAEITLEIKDGNIFANFIAQFPPVTKKGEIFFNYALNSTIKQEVKDSLNDMNILFVDLGLNSVFSGSLYEYKKNDNNGEIKIVENNSAQYGSASLIDQFQLKSITSNLQNKIFNLIKKAEKIKYCIAFYKKISEFDSTSYKRKIKQNVELDEVYYNKAILKFNYNKDYNQNDLDKLYVQILNENKKLNLEFKKIKLNRNFSYNKNYKDISAGYKWIGLIKSIIDIKKSLTNVNLQFSKDKKPKYIFKHDYNYLNNFSDNFAKILASHLKNYCIKNNVQLVVFEENLENFKTSYFNSKSSNKLLMNWANRNLMQKIDLALSEINVTVSTVDGRHTSQLDPETMNFGARDEYDKSKIYYLRNNQIVTENCDLSASKVLAKRYLTRNKDVSYIYVDTKLDENNNEIKLILSKDKKIISSYLKNQVQSEYAIIDNNGLLKPISNSEYNILEKLKSKPRKDFNSNKMYKNNNIWISFEEHKKFQNNLVARANDVQKTPLPLVAC